MKRRRLRWALLAAPVLLWCGYVVVSSLQAASDLRTGRRALDAAREKASVSGLVEGEPLADLRAARLRFARAQDRLDGFATAPVRIVPLVGRQLRSVAQLSGAAAGMLEIGIRSISEAQQFLDDDLDDGRRRHLAVRRLAELAERTDQQLAGVAIEPQDRLLSPIADARNEYTEELDDLRAALRKAAVGGRAVADLLAGPRRYLVFGANNGEMRAGSGMFLSAGELITGDEGMRLQNMRSVTEIPVPAEGVSLTGDLADRWGWLAPNTEWRNLMLSPRFDVNASLAAEMWVAAGNPPVDGVLAVDPVTLRALLVATGPVEVDGRHITEDNVVAELLHDQYVRFPSLEEREERREELGQIAGAVFDALDQRSSSAARLISGLAEAARGRHILLWSKRPEEQAGWQALGVAGDLREDSLLVSVLNRGGNKLDQFLEASAELSVEPGAGGHDVTVRLHLHNTVPTGEVGYIAGPDPQTDLDEGDYLGLLTLNMPASATGGRFEGVEQLAVAGADGPTRVIGFQLGLARGEERTVVGRFRVPAALTSLRVEPSARIPAIAWTSGEQRWSDGEARTVPVARQS